MVETDLRFRPGWKCLELGNILKSLGFTQQLEVDPCLFVKKKGNRITHVLAYHVDDALIIWVDLPNS